MNKLNGFSIIYPSPDRRHKKEMCSFCKSKIWWDTIAHQHEDITLHDKCVRDFMVELRRELVGQLLDIIQQRYVLKDEFNINDNDPLLDPVGQVRAGLIYSKELFSKYMHLIPDIQINYPLTYKIHSHGN